MSDLDDTEQKALGLKIKDKRANRKMNRGMFAEWAKVSVLLLASMEHGRIDLQNPDCIKVLQKVDLYTPEKLLPPTKKRKWKRFKLHSSFSVLKRRLPRKQASIHIRRR